MTGCAGGWPDLVLAALLKRLREERRVSQEDLAFEAGITVSALSRIERGINSPGWMTVMRVLDALDVSLEQLGKTWRCRVFRLLK
jgi:transcriptional regulator with XRE-family HTH domain